MNYELETVKCTKCDFKGREEDLILIEDKGEFYKGCKECKTDSYLMDIND